MLTESEMKEIKEEAEKEYPDTDWEWVNRLLEMKREVYTLAVTKERERVKPLVEALEEITEPINAMRKRLKEDERLDGIWAIALSADAVYLKDIARKALTDYNKSLKQTQH